MDFKNYSLNIWSSKLNVLFHICHPAHVHFFRNVINLLKKNTDHKVFIATRSKEITELLLKKYDLEFINLTTQKKGIIRLFFEFISQQYKIFWFIKKNKIDIILSIGGAFNVHSAKLLGIKSWVFYDTEHAKLNNAITYRFATKVFTPDCYILEIGKNHIRYPGYHELAYLHPHWFEPNPKVLDDLDIKQNEVFFVLRFVSWEAAHDFGKKRLSFVDKLKLIDTLKSHGKVIISSEKPLPKEFEKYKMKLCPTKMHDLLYYASLYIGEGGTMASEAAVLGTYSIYINELPTMGYIKEEIERYNLIFKSTNIDDIINHLQSMDLNKIITESKEKRKLIIQDKIDVTDYIYNQIQN